MFVEFSLCAKSCAKEVLVGYLQSSLQPCEVGIVNLIL